MYESQDIPKTAGAVAGWQAFAADGKARMDRELALSAKCDLLFPLRSLYNAPQPIAIYFYGPGPDGRLHPEGPPVGTLHFARWRHEFAAFVDPDGLGYYHEDNPMTINGQQIRPTYTTKGNQVAREVNYFRWERVPAQFLAGVKTYPGPGATRAIHDEYLLNHDDFNDHDVERRKVRADLDNRLDEDPKTIYPLGYRLLKKWSQVNGHPQWQEGVCLGADPGNSDALTKHIGWFPKRLRRTKAGLGADPQDAVWKEVFHGNVDAKAKEIFTPPKDRWSDDPSKVTTMTCSKSSHMAQDHDSVLTFDIVSLSALKEILSLPEPDTLDARNTWLDGRAPIRRLGYRAKEDLKPSGLATSESETIYSHQVMTEMVVHEKESTSTEESQVSEISEKTAAYAEKLAIRDNASEEHQAVEATLHELSINPPPGKEGRKPILEYSAFRSRLLGMPVTHILGYE